MVFIVFCRSCFSATKVLVRYDWVFVGLKARPTGD